MEYYVKFVPYNEKTLDFLINKTIKFSTVLEFNDPTELRLYPSNLPELHKELNEIHEKELENCEYIYDCIKNIEKSGHFKPDYLLKLKKDFNEYHRSKKNNQTSSKLISTDSLISLSQILAYNKIGIFCVSSLDVFDSDAGTLMFAHYAHHQKGLALIYECPPNDFSHVKYYKKYRSDDNRDNNDPFSICQWHKGNFKNISDFFKKSENWEYENEFRLFHKPGTVKAEEHKINLKAILYTTRFDENNIEALKNINKKFYKNDLEIKSVVVSSSGFSFVLVEEKSPLNK